MRSEALKLSSGKPVWTGEGTMYHFDDILEELRDVYLEETLERSAAMAATLDTLERESASGSGALADLVVYFHRLAGTGTCYGLAELSLLGRMGEYDSGTRQRMGGACSQEEVCTWRALISQIQAAALGNAFSGPFPAGEGL